MSRVVLECQQNDIRLIHTAAFDQPEQSHIELLLSAGFVQRSSIEEWVLDSPSLCWNPVESSIYAYECTREPGERLPFVFRKFTTNGAREVARSQLCDLVRKTVDRHPGIGGFVPDSESILNLWESLCPNARLGMAVDGDVLHGLVVSTTGTARTTLQYVGVISDYRRRGVGASLVASVGAPLVAYVDGENAPAQQFYNDLGFSVSRRCSPWFRRLGSDCRS